MQPTLICLPFSSLVIHSLIQATMGSCLHILKARGIYSRILSEGVTCSDLPFKKTTLALPEEEVLVEQKGKLRDQFHVLGLMLRLFLSLE